MRWHSSEWLRIRADGRRRIDELRSSPVPRALHSLKKCNSTEIFEDNQANLEQAVEDLSGMLEQQPIDATTIMQLKSDMVNKTNYVEKRAGIILSDTLQGHYEVSYEVSGELRGGVVDERLADGGCVSFSLVGSSVPRVLCHLSANVHGPSASILCVRISDQQSSNDDDDTGTAGQPSLCGFNCSCERSVYYIRWNTITILYISVRVERSANVQPNLTQKRSRSRSNRFRPISPV